VFWPYFTDQRSAISSLDFWRDRFLACFYAFLPKKGFYLTTLEKSAAKNRLVLEMRLHYFIVSTLLPALSAIKK
jgi:hypothetical protein